MTITLDNLTAGYDRHPAVHHLSGAFNNATLTAIIGPNGGGKSTLLKTLIGFLRPMSGKIDCGGVEQADIAYLSQLSEVDRNFPLKVMDVVMLGLWRKNGAFGRATPIQRDNTMKALEQVGMGTFANRPISALSSGQWQRVLFARLVMQNARVLLLDEPFAAIDSRTTHDLMHLLQHWQGEGRTVIAVMHDLPLVREHFSYVLMLSREPVAWGKTADVLCDENFSRAAHLASHWDDHADKCERAA
jgi:zinc/manganese transport system ATP-binding protein